MGRRALDLVAFAGKARHTLSPMSEIILPSRISRVTSMKPAGMVSLRMIAAIKSVTSPGGNPTRRERRGFSKRVPRAPEWLVAACSGAVSRLTARGHLIARLDSVVVS